MRNCITLWFIAEKQLKMFPFLDDCKIKVLLVICNEMFIQSTIETKLKSVFVCRGSILLNISLTKTLTANKIFFYRAIFCEVTINSTRLIQKSTALILKIRCRDPQIRISGNFTPFGTYRIFWSIRCKPHSCPNISTSPNRAEFWNFSKDKHCFYDKISLFSSENVIYKDRQSQHLCDELTKKECFQIDFVFYFLHLK